MQFDLGPSSNAPSEYGTKYLLHYMQQCTEYVSNLPPFHQYCVWRYTIGSASINSLLIFNKVPENGKFWCYLFFQYFYNTFNHKGLMTKPIFASTGIRGPLVKFVKYFKNPALFMEEATEEMVGYVLAQYIKILTNIINKAPSPSKTISVFKVASKYPGLPDGVGTYKESVDVLQLPFNSTTIDPHFNFGIFVPSTTLASPGIGCCLFKINLSPSCKCLYIPQEFHAYPFENEVLLPPQTVFRISSADVINLKYVDVSTVNVTPVQKKGEIVMGPVYEVETYAPCKNGRPCVTGTKPFHTYNVNI